MEVLIYFVPLILLAYLLFRPDASRFWPGHLGREMKRHSLEQQIADYQRDVAALVAEHKAAEAAAKAAIDEAQRPPEA